MSEQTPADTTTDVYRKRQEEKARWEAYRDAAKQLYPDMTFNPECAVSENADKTGAFLEGVVWIPASDIEKGIKQNPYPPQYPEKVWIVTSGRCSFENVTKQGAKLTLDSAKAFAAEVCHHLVFVYGLQDTWVERGNVDTYISWYQGDHYVRIESIDVVP